MIFKSLCTICKPAITSAICLGVLSFGVENSANAAPSTEQQWQTAAPAPTVLTPPIYDFAAEITALIDLIESSEQTHYDEYGDGEYVCESTEFGEEALASLEEEVECQAQKTVEIKTTAYVELISDKAKKAYKDNALVKGLVDSFNNKKPESIVTGVPVGVPFDQLEPNLYRGLTGGTAYISLNLGMNFQGLKEGVDYKIKFNEIEIIKWILQCCKKIFPAPKELPKK